MYGPAKTTTPSRHPERAHHERETIHAILDEALIGHLAFIARGLPQILPLLFVRVEDSLYLHGSTGAHFARRASRGGGLAVSFEVTLVDGLVLARSAFNHSANYRCVVAHGEARVVSDAGLKLEVLTALMDKLIAGRKGEARLPDPDELRQTAVLELPLTTVGAKVRSGGPLDAEEDRDRPIWAGVRPIVAHFGVPVAADDLGPGIEVPPYLAPRPCGGGLLAGGGGAISA